MPSHIGEVEIPHQSPHFLACRVAVRHHVAQYGCGPVVIGLSGGADSLSLVAEVLAAGLDCRIVIVDHGLSHGSDRVAEDAATTALRLGAEKGSVRIVSVTVPPDAIAATGVEAAARTVRYRALHAAACQKGLSGNLSPWPVWVAHTVDDQAETFLVGALRGRATGMQCVSSGAEGVVIHRPFLRRVRRSDTVTACAELGLNPWQDPMNGDTAFTRVAVRKLWLPKAFELIGGDAVPALAAAGLAAGEQRDFVCTVVKDHLNQALVGKNNSRGTGLSVEYLVGLHPAVKRGVVTEWLRCMLETTVKPAAVAQVMDLVDNWHGQGPVAVGGDRHRRTVVMRKGGKLVTVAVGLTGS